MIHDYAFLVSLREYFATLLDSTLYIYFSISSTLFLVHCAIVLTIMDHFFGESRDDPSLPYLMDPVNLIITTVYYTVFQKLSTGMTEVLVEYYGVLQKAEEIALRGDAKTRMYAKHFVVLADYMYRPRGWYFSIDQYQPEGSEFSGNAYARFDQLYRMAIADGKGDELAPLYAIVRGRQQREAVKKSGFTDSHMIMILYAFFGIWLPIRLWTSELHFYGTLMIYPFFMYIFTAPILYRWWSGDAWSASRPRKGAPHELWPYFTIERIKAMDVS